MTMAYLTHEMLPWQQNYKYKLEFYNSYIHWFVTIVIWVLLHNIEWSSMLFCFSVHCDSSRIKYFTVLQSYIMKFQFLCTISYYRHYWLKRTTAKCFLFQLQLINIDWKPEFVSIWPQFARCHWLAFHRHIIICLNPLKDGFDTRSRYYD